MSFPDPLDFANAAQDRWQRRAEVAEAMLIGALSDLATTRSMLKTTAESSAAETRRAIYWQDRCGRAEQDLLALQVARRHVTDAQLDAAVEAYNRTQPEAIRLQLSRILNAALGVIR